METYTVENAQHRLNQLLSDAHQGKTVVIAAENGWAATLVPIPLRAKQARQAGSARSQLWMADDFDDPLQDFADFMA